MRRPTLQELQREVGYTPGLHFMTEPAQPWWKRHVELEEQVSEPNPGRIAEFDQAAAELRCTAQLLGSYFHDLINAGFTRPEALDLTLALQEALQDDDA